jgi:hypothetical protein
MSAYDIVSVGGQQPQEAAQVISNSNEATQVSSRLKYIFVTLLGKITLLGAKTLLGARPLLGV